AVEWLRNQRGEVIPPFQLVARQSWLGNSKRYWNCGEPSYRNVLAFDMDVLHGPIYCQHCHEHLAVAAHIDDGVVSGAKALTAESARSLFGREPEDLETAIINDDG